MEQTYTFSRALHMMRYGGATMRSERTCYKLYHGKLIELHNQLGWIECSQIYAHEIMGSWVEVKEETI